MKPKQDDVFELEVDRLSTVYLRGAARWARFLAVVGFIFCGLSLVTAILFASVFSNLFASLGSGGLGKSGGWLGGVFACISLLNFIPCFHLYHFGYRMRLALDNNDQKQLGIAFRNMRSFYRLVGVMMLICMGIWLLIILLMIALPPAARLNA